MAGIGVTTHGYHTQEFLLRRARIKDDLVDEQELQDHPAGDLAAGSLSRLGIRCELAEICVLVINAITLGFLPGSRMVTEYAGLVYQEKP